ncbi:DNA-binding transcriptional LysR family regulator [Actinoplanes campanulatus]|uniref:DNA-binding transcriptional LysR family regulator n=1 Tax=Actinoplanes campanulatus TaxID=113559 RepID=A0A7W5ARK5_9ACTN|nr:DNA-binding transcriptional LysR family regulator [Actinoplanes campanulatus]
MGETPTAAEPARLDLNLLVALDVLLRERSVTRAAERLDLTQPTLSASLRRLRRHVKDELLVRVGNRNELIPLGVVLAPLVATALGVVSRRTSRAGLRLGCARVGAAVAAADRGAGLRPPRQRRPGIHADPGLRRLGARLPARAWTSWSRS